MGKRRALDGNSWPMRPFLLPTENPSCPRDQKIPRRYRLKVSNEPKTWREHCHRSYPGIFDSFSFYGGGNLGASGDRPPAKESWNGDTRKKKLCRYRPFITTFLQLIPVLRFHGVRVYETKHLRYVIERAVFCSLLQTFIRTLAFKEKFRREFRIQLFHLFVERDSFLSNGKRNLWKIFETMQDLERNYIYERC